MTVSAATPATPSTTGQAPVQDNAARLPELLADGRRGIFLRLIGTGLAQAALVVQTVVAVPIALDATAFWPRTIALLSLAGAALLLGLVRARERILAERLGQHYVQQIRTGLVASAISGSGPSLGTTVARTTNDLTSVRNWVAQGIAPITAAVPLIIGTIVALTVLHPALALAVGVPVLGLAIWLVAWTPRMYARSRELRRVRGRLAAHLADTVAAAEPIRAAGGSRRELNHVRRRGRGVQQAAVARARVAGTLRGGAIAAGGLATASVLAVAGTAAIPVSAIATALTVVGILAGPLADLGRVSEYRQSFRAARRILGPALVPGRQQSGGPPAGSNSSPAAEVSTEPGWLSVSGLVVDGTPVPDLHAMPGERIVLRGSPQRSRAVIDALVGGASGEIRLAGLDLNDVSDRDRRRVLGAAAQGWPLERGTLARAIGYRLPDEHAVPLEPTLRTAGLNSLVDRLPDGIGTRLRHGGAPLDPAERSQVLLARALHGQPPLILLHRILDGVTTEAREAVRTGLADQPGIVLAVTDEPDAMLGHWRSWPLQQDASRSAA